MTAAARRLKPYTDDLEKAGAQVDDPRRPAALVILAAVGYEESPPSDAAEWVINQR